MPREAHGDVLTRSDISLMCRSLFPTLKTCSRSVISNAVKDLSVSYSSPIGFDIEQYSSQSDDGFKTML